MMSNSTTTSTLRPDAGSPLHSRAHQDRCRRWHRPKCLSGPQPDPLSAVGAGAIKINPAAGVRLPRSERGEMVFLTPGQVHDLAAELSENDGLLVTFAAYTGLRAAEIAGLRVGRVDLGGVWLTLSRQSGRRTAGWCLGPRRLTSDERFPSLVPRQRTGVAAGIAIVPSRFPRLHRARGWAGSPQQLLQASLPASGQARRTAAGGAISRPSTYVRCDAHSQRGSPQSHRRATGPLDHHANPRQVRAPVPGSRRAAR